jgi:succinate-semialdehyde dehydrogenase/glutarate-semialdehyde dehydrogenase
MATQKKSLNDIKNKKLLQSKGLINGEWVDSVSGKSTFDVVDPATLDKIATLPEMDKVSTFTLLQSMFSMMTLLC